MIEKGNIDLNNRKIYRNPDGSISTVDSVSFNINGQEVLLPTIVDGKRVTEEEALNRYYRTGEHLGKFKTPEEATKYAQQLHMRQQMQYGDKPKKLQMLDDLFTAKNTNKNYIKER